MVHNDTLVADLRRKLATAESELAIAWHAAQEERAARLRLVGQLTQLKIDRPRPVVVRMGPSCGPAGCACGD